MHVHAYITKKNEAFLSAKCIMWLIKHAEYFWIGLLIILISCTYMIIGLFHLNTLSITCTAYDC